MTGRVRHRTRTVLSIGAAAAVLATGCTTSTSLSTKVLPARPTAPTPSDWPTYGHDAQHTFHGRTTLTAATAKALKVAWFFPTSDVVTATPTVVDGTVYVGSWDDAFYALDFATGALRWQYRLSPQNAVTPYPGQNPRDVTSDGGLVTSSAWYEPGAGARPDLVIFGAGYTLYALDATTGALYWRHDYSGRPGRPLDPATDQTRIFSSPVVADGLVLFGVDTDGQRGSHGYIVGASVSSGDPVWEFQTDTDHAGRVMGDGCGSVWSSGTVLQQLGTVVFDTADCKFSDNGPLSEAILALHIDNGHLAWVYRPNHPDLACDWDFGATANAGIAAGGVATFLGAGGKDGTYYSLDPATGHLRWATNVVFGGFSGGFIATTAYDGRRVYGTIALGDFGRFEKDSQILCDPSNPRDTPIQQPTVNAFGAATGAVAWQSDGRSSFAPTTVAGGMTFNGPASGSLILVRDAASGDLLDSIATPGPVWSGIATVGNALVTGIGESYNAQPAGVAVLTPGGARPIEKP